MSMDEDSLHVSGFDVTVRAAIRYKDWKLLTGNPGQYLPSSVTPASGVFGVMGKQEIKNKQTCISYL